MRCCTGTAPSHLDRVLDPEKEALFTVYYPVMRMPTGCPVGECGPMFAHSPPTPPPPPPPPPATAQGTTLLRCLEQQRLTDFLQVIMEANLTGLINSTTSNMTLFAPANGQIPSNLSPAEARELVLSHLVPGSWVGSQLVCGVRLESMTGHFLHVGSVEHTHRRRAIQNSRYYYIPVNPAFREVLPLKTVSAQHRASIMSV